MLRELHGYDETSSCHAGQLTEPAIILVGRGILTRLVVPGTVFSSTHEAERLLLELGNALAQPTCRLEEIDIARSKHMAGIPLDHLFPEAQVGRCATLSSKTAVGAAGSRSTWRAAPS